jgi:hypothetical protein
LRFTFGMDADAAAPLAVRLSVGLGSHGVCYPCLGEVAYELEEGNGHRVEQWVVPTLWVEGLGVTVTTAVERAVQLGLPDAEAALGDLAARGCRSGIFRAVVRRLARELHQQTQRAIAAALN